MGGKCSLGGIEKKTDEREVFWRKERWDDCEKQDKLILEGQACRKETM